MDSRAYRWVNRLQVRTGWAHVPLRVYAKDGIVVFAVLLLVGWALTRRDPSAAPLAKVAWAGAAAIVGLIVNQVVGHLVDRARPYASHPGAHLLVSRTRDFSFPSDHAVVAGAVAAGLFLAHRRIGVVAIVAALAMAFARVYVGAHYPGDVIAGLVIGALVAIAGRVGAVPAIAWLVDRARTSPLRALVGGGAVAPGP